MMIVSNFGFLVIGLLEDATETLNPQKFLHVTISMSYLVTVLLILSHLYIFGCCIRKTKNKMRELVTDLDDELDGSNDKKYTVKCYDLLTSYKQMKESVSLGLFLIFTLITIISIFYIFSSIIFFGELVDDICNILWCTVCLLILVYLGLACDEADQARLNLVDNMW